MKHPESERLIAEYQEILNKRERIRREFISIHSRPIRLEDITYGRN